MEEENQNAGLTEAKEASQEKTTRLAKRAVFDVVSSVKGGSGKSTFSLLLAAYYNSAPGAVAYILDLDLRGTSWEKNYGRYMSTPFFETGDPVNRNSLWDYYHALFDESGEPLSRGKALSEDTKTLTNNYRNYPFINALMGDFGQYQSRAFWTEIPFKTASSEGAIKLCPARAANGVEVDQLEVDISEHTIYQLICHILDRHRRDESLEEVHIILDMPPSYEKHAEAVLKHLLVNEESDLFRHARKRKKQFGVSKDDVTRYYLPYEIRLYLMCARNPAHVEQNGIYLSHWLKNRKYSDAIIDLIKDNKAVVKTQSGQDNSLSTEPINRFLIRFVINDISGNFWESKDGRRDSPKSEFEQYKDWSELYFKKKEGESSSFYSQAKKSFEGLDPKFKDLITFCAFPHVNLPATFWEMEAENAPSQHKRIIIEKDKINPLEYVERVLL